MNKIVDTVEMADSLEAEAAYLAKWVDENEGIVDTTPVQYSIQAIYEISQSLRMKGVVRAQAAMALLMDEIDD